MSLPAFWLAALPDIATRPWRAPEPGTATVLVPELTPDLLRRQVDALLASGEQLRRRRARSIIQSIGAVARRFVDPADPLRREAVDILPRVTGMSAPMAELVLDRMAKDWGAEALERLVAAELGSVSVLDGFGEVGERRTHALGPKLIFHLFSGNVPGVAVTSLIRGLLVKAPSLGKSASGEPVLPALFAQALAEEDAELGAAVAVAYWPGGDVDLEREAMERAECVVAYGSQESIEALRGRAPSTARFVEHGSRVSFAVVLREALSRVDAEQSARDAALAVATFDQQGCVSPHVIYVEGGGDVDIERWGAQLASALGRLERELPRGAITQGEASAIQQLRGRAEVRSLVQPGYHLHASAGGTAWTVVISPDAAFEASCLQRTVWVKAVADASGIPALVAPLGAQLQTVGIAGADRRAAELGLALASVGASRIAPVAEMAWPGPAWHHDGRGPLWELVRFCDWG